jgi:hypothetical protein
MNAKLGAVWQAIYDGTQTPADAFTQIAEEIRQVMAEEQA